MDQQRDRKPPVIARWILERILPRSIREFAMGDLEEDFRAMVESDGLHTARRWYFRQVAKCFVTRKSTRKEEASPRTGDPWRKTFLADVNYGIRVLLKKPGFFIASVLTLGIGIGASTAIFSAVNSVILKPFPFLDTDRIVTIWENNLKAQIPREDVSPANFLDWQDRQQVFEDMATMNPWGLDYTGGGEPETWQSALVSKGFFEILGVKPFLGRTFLPEEFQEGKNHVVVLSYGLWQRKFGGDRSVVGQTLSLDGEPTTIIGVMPSEFRLHFDAPDKEAFQPQVVSERWKYQRRATYLKVLAKLKPSVTLEQAQSSMKAIAAQLSMELPQSNGDVSVEVISLREHLIGKVQLAFWVLLASVGFLVLIGCANLANLQLARGLQRQQELAIRLAMGASRSRIVQQLMIENFLLALFGCVAGLLIAKWGIQMIVAAGPENIPRLNAMKLDWLVSLFATLLSFMTVLLFGLFPSLHVSRFALHRSLKKGAGSVIAGGISGRLRNALVVSQIAVAIILLVGAGLFSRSFTHLLQVNPGFTGNGVVALQAFLYYDRYQKPEGRLQFTNEAVSRLKAVPGVESVGITTALPFLDSSSGSSYPLIVEGQPVPPGQEPTAFLTVATEDYFKVLQIPLQMGRVFHPEDHANGPLTAILNEIAAKRLNLGSNPVGKRIQVQLGQKVSSMEVIGVVGSTRHEGLDQHHRPEFFLPYGKTPSGHVIFVVRTSTDPGPVIASLKRAIWEIDPSLPFYTVVTLEQLVRESTVERRFHLILLGSFAGVALLLCALGIYAFISFITSQRTGEIGIRMALGAQKPDIWRLITTDAVRLAITGIAIGIVVAFLLTRYVRSLLFEVQLLDPVTYAAGIMILLLVALLACLLPARRAMRIDPLTALRYE
jgi:putative ABC transport system permease protein